MTSWGPLLSWTVYVRRLSNVVPFALITTACGARSSLQDTSDHDVSDFAPTNAVTEPTSTSEPSLESDSPPIIQLPTPCTSADAPSGLPFGPSQDVGPTRGEALDEQCGNGRHEEYETCDDGNRTAGDGCDERCRIEPFYVCVTGGEPCARLDVCGDGILSSDEECDDGNWLPLDGCSPSCQRESACWTSPSACTNCLSPDPPCTNDGDPGFCGDGIVQAERGELCDHIANDSAYGGCTADCSLAARCGDLIVQTCGNETCDDGNRAGGDGCSAACKREQLWVR
jgi:cysteine-rich repeat protein